MQCGNLINGDVIFCEACIMNAIWGDAIFPAVSCQFADGCRLLSLKANGPFLLLPKWLAIAWNTCKLRVPCWCSSQSPNPQGKRSRTNYSYLQRRHFLIKVESKNSDKTADPAVTWTQWSSMIWSHSMSFINILFVFCAERLHLIAMEWVWSPVGIEPLKWVIYPECCTFNVQPRTWIWYTGSVH